MKRLIYISLLVSTVISCSKEKGCTDSAASNYYASARLDDGSCEYPATSTPYNFTLPGSFQSYLPPPEIPADNPMTIEGIALGRKLFYDPILSGDNTQACASCHDVSHSFSDTTQFSIGIDGGPGNRNAMPIFNLAWNISNKFFWDGRATSIEDQASQPVINPVEMHDTWPNAISKIQNDPNYPGLFKEAFGIDANEITTDYVTKAIAQFERTLISGNSKFDQYLMGQATLTTSELNGLDIFMTETGDCFHCHGSATNPLWTDNQFHNNAIDSVFADSGLAAVTLNSADLGKFKTPSLRNLIYTAPYMHDGRFATLDEVIMHYSTGLVHSSTDDPLMLHLPQGGAQLTPQEMIDLKAFLLTLSDPDFVANPDFQAP